MSTRSKKSDAVQFLEKISGGPLTFGKMLRAIRLGEELSQGFKAMAPLFPYAIGTCDSSVTHL